MNKSHHQIPKSNAGTVTLHAPQGQEKKMNEMDQEQTPMWFPHF